ncbi:Acyl-CoA desaturase [Pleurotus pulmonarius]
MSSEHPQKETHHQQHDKSSVPDNYVTHTLKQHPPLPPFQWRNWRTEITWIPLVLLVSTPLIAAIGACYTPLRWQTALFSVFYYYVTGMGITAGYHRQWSHRSYTAALPLQYALAMAGAGACQGSIKWWSRNHRAHHRYTDTPLDPYNATDGFYHSHIGWLLVKPRIKPGFADIQDLSKDEVVRWQLRWYLTLTLVMGFALPTAVPWLAWGDAQGGYVYAAVMRLVFVHHSTFCVNSLAHWLGAASFDDKHSPRDHLLTALVSIGEGYHNFHHQFPADYRNAIHWYQYDPTKWFIAACEALGLAHQLRRFGENEVRKGAWSMKVKEMRREQEGLVWPSASEELPVVGWEEFQEQARTPARTLVLVAGFIHDLAPFLDAHPGGRALLATMAGKDATTAFFGGIYDHSNAAHNLLAMHRVAVLHGGCAHAADEKFVPPAQRLRIVCHDE